MLIRLHEDCEASVVAPPLIGCSVLHRLGSQYPVRRCSAGDNLCFAAQPSPSMDAVKGRSVKRYRREELDSEEQLTTVEEDEEWVPSSSFRQLACMCSLKTDISYLGMSQGPRICSSEEETSDGGGEASIPP